MDALLNRYAGAVWLRNFLTWRRLFWPSMASNVCNPLLFLFAFGFGLGALVGEVGGISYLAFVVPGMMAYSAMFAASFETSIAAFSRFHMQRTWDAMLSTPLTLAELLMGELLWATSKAMLSSISVLVVAMLWGGVLSPWGALLALPALFLAGLCFAACGLLGTAHARDWEFFSYFFTFWITPMFIFSGTFFEVSRFPQAIEWLAWVLPMTHLIAVIRPLTTGADLGLAPATLHLAYLALLTSLAFWAAHRKLAARLFD